MMSSETVSSIKDLCRPVTATEVLSTAAVTPDPYPYTTSDYRILELAKWALEMGVYAASEDVRAKANEIILKALTPLMVVK